MRIWKSYNQAYGTMSGFRSMIKAWIFWVTINVFVGVCIVSITADDLLWFEYLGPILGIPALIVLYFALTRLHEDAEPVSAPAGLPISHHPNLLGIVKKLMFLTGGGGMVIGLLFGYMFFHMGLLEKMKASNRKNKDRIWDIVTISSVKDYSGEIVAMDDFWVVMTVKEKPEDGEINIELSTVRSISCAHPERVHLYPPK